MRKVCNINKDERVSVNKIRKNEKKINEMQGFNTKTLHLALSFLFPLVRFVLLWIIYPCIGHTNILLFYVFIYSCFNFYLFDLIMA